MIDDSFWWDETKHPYLWDKIFDAIPSHQTLSELVKDKEGLEDIKEQIKDLL